MNANQLLSRLFELNSLPQAMILEGALNLSEKDLTSLIMNYCCESKNTCGECQHCQLLFHNEHPDVIHIRPHEEGHPIKIEQIREINQLCQQTPYLLNYKLIILHHAETMNLFASNALLKTLEESLSQVHFFLLVTNARVLPKTILSRCWFMQYQHPLPLSMVEFNFEESKCNGSNLFEQEGRFIELISNFIQGHKDLLSCIQFFDAYQIEEVLLFLQWVTQNIIQEKLELQQINYSIPLIAALPLQIWWKFWDRIEYYRCELQTKKNLQPNLLLSELFTILLVLNEESNDASINY
jgi:DNA polymerase III gamma/tau subunit